MRASLAGLTVAFVVTWASAQQLTIARVEQMPNLPEPYRMRDWKQVARDYDSLVFDLQRTGQYLPLVWLNTNPINYPEHSSFGLHTYVGTKYPDNAEAINVLPAVNGATLVGIDKRNQFSYNWVLGCEEFFNRRPEENVYLNNPATESGDDWWYATMPNVFFYQLYDLYPGTGDFDFQLRSIADQWLRAVEKMGGSATPWTLPNMHYRGWYLSTMQPYTTGVTEPEAAGAIAWLLYLAYVKTGETRYRWGAEWALEFLNGLSRNPAYELQLPYGAYVAARMNAELGTTYDVARLLDWCFDPTDNVREWGVTLGRWGAYDCYGLVGEARLSGYAFAMNTFQMAAALVPLVRYDERFARAIGKWMLNLANAARLFYSAYLPAGNQDGADWAQQYDPQSCLAHEALRQSYYGATPYATGDAVKGGWSNTNYALYGASHVGYLAAIVDTTDVPGILRLDLRATDFFQQQAYPSYLFYNPYSEPRTITWEVGPQPVDIYETVNNAFLKQGVAGQVALTIPADAALVAVLVPTGGQVSYAYDRLLVDGVVVDYRTGKVISDYPPRIKALATDRLSVAGGDTVHLYCTAVDPERGRLTFSWCAGSRQLPDTLPQISWVAPALDSTLTIYCTVSDQVNPPVRDSLRIQVYTTLNQAPVITELYCQTRKVDPGDTTHITCRAFDADGDQLNYSWSASGGTCLGSDSSINWIAPLESGFYWVQCVVGDGRGGRVADSISFQVRDPALPQIGDPVLYLPFCGSAQDFSGLHNDGTTNNVMLTADRHGIPDMAYLFDGITSSVRIPVSASLNCRDAISVSLWLKPTQLFATRESYPISHGNWENRWKISIIPTQKIRWTVKTTAGVKDLDSKTAVSAHSWYHIVGSYDGTNFRLYVNGQLESQTTFSGRILTTNIDLTIGQVLPGNTQYNFRGIIDDVRLYDYAIDTITIRQLYEETSSFKVASHQLPAKFVLWPNYPNPFNPATVIKWDLPEEGRTKLTIYDLRGNLIATLVDGLLPAGSYSYTWHSAGVSSGLYFFRLQCGQKVATHKCLKIK